MSRINQVSAKINEKLAYDTVSDKFVSTFFKKVKIHYGTVKGNVNLELDFIKSVYSGRNSVLGSTDYNDHSNNTKKDFNALIAKYTNPNGGYVRCLQLGNYYNQDGTLVTDVLIKGHIGGWSCEFIYKTDKSFLR